MTSEAKPGPPFVIAQMRSNERSPPISESVITEAVAGFCLAAGALAGVAHLALEAPAGPDAATWPAVALPAVALMAAGPMGAAFFLWDAGMKRGDPRLLGTLAYATPVASTLLLVAIGEGALTWPVLAAVALVAGGGLLAATAGRRG